MSQTQRFTSRTIGRAERRETPAPYPSTKPAPKPKKEPSSVWDYIKSWSFFGPTKETAIEEPEPTPEPSSSIDAPPLLQEIITRHKTASPNIPDTQEVVAAMQAMATKNLYECGLEVQREHEQMIQEMIPPPSTSPSEPTEQEKPVPKVYHLPFYRRPGTKEWFIQDILERPGQSPNEKVANFLKDKSFTSVDEVELSAIMAILSGDPSAKLDPPAPAPAPPPVSSNRSRQPTGKEILARIQPKPAALPVFIDEWITKPRVDYCLPGDDIWDGKIYSNRPRDIPQGMEYRTLSGGRGYLAKKRPGGFWGTPQPTASTSKRPRLDDGGLSANASAPTNLSLPSNSTDPELLTSHGSTSKPPPPSPLITTAETKPLAESQKNDEAQKKETPAKKSQTYKTMQEIVIEEAARKAVEEKERQMQELKERAMAALDGGAGRPPIRRNRPILRYPIPQDSGKKSSSKKNQPKNEPAKKVPTVNDILDIHTGRADPSQFDAPATAAPSVLRLPAMKPYDPTPRQRSPKRSLEEHQQEHGEVETAETSPKKKVKTNGVALATDAQALSGSGAAVEDAIIIDDLDEEMTDPIVLPPTVPLPTPAPAPAPAPAQAPAPAPAPAPAQAPSMPPPPSKLPAMSTLPPVNPLGPPVKPLGPPHFRAFSPSRPSPLRMVSSVDSPEGSPNPTPFSIFNAKLKPEPEVLDVHAEEEDQLAEDNEKTPTSAPTLTIVAPPAPAPVFKRIQAPAPVTQAIPQPTVSSWSIPMPKVIQPVPPSSPKSIARNAPASSLPHYSMGLSGTPLCYDVGMGEPEAQTIARTVSQDELPAFEIDLSPMFDSTLWIERKSMAPPVRSVPASTVCEASKPDAPVTSALPKPAPKPIPFNWAAAGMKPSTPVVGEWTCPVCNCRTKDTLSKCSVCEAPKPTIAAPAPAPTPVTSALPKFTPFNWAAAGMMASTPVVGEWTCPVCNCRTKDTLSKCSVCEALKPNAAASAAALAPVSPTMPPLIPAAAPVTPAPVAFDWAAAGMKPSTPVVGEWTCPVCNCRTKDTLSKCSVCEAPKPNTAASAPAPTPVSPGMPALIPAAGPDTPAPVAFDWAAAGLKLPAKAAGTWTCRVCVIDNKPDADKCMICDELRPSSAPVPAPLGNGFILPPPMRNNGLKWGIPPSAIVASEPAISGN